MNSNLESFCPKLRPGRVIPQGSRIIFETDNPYNQIILPMALADMVLLCSGQFSMREIVEKIYQKQGVVPFKSMLTAVHLLHQGGFFENGDQLALSSHLQSWMEPRNSQWGLSWRFGQRISSEGRHPHAYYVLTILFLLGAMMGLLYFPANPLESFAMWSHSQDVAWCLFQLLLSSSVLQTLRYSICVLQLLLLTSKAYNVAFRLSPWGIHLYVGDEANDLFENRLFTILFHFSQIFLPWTVVGLVSNIWQREWLDPLMLMASLISFRELNPFLHSEGRKLIRAMLMDQSSDVISWHFESNALIHSMNPEARRKAFDFARLCNLWGIAWLIACGYFLYDTATAFGPSVLFTLTANTESSRSIIGIGAWLALLFYVVQASVEILVPRIVGSFLRPIWLRVKGQDISPQKQWTSSDLLKGIEALPLFSHFHEHFLEKIATQSEVLHFLPGSVIAATGSASKDLFVLLEGEVEVERAGLPSEEWRVVLGAVSIFGESALVDDGPRPSAVEARTQVTVLRVPLVLLKEVALEAQSVRKLEVFRNAILVNQFFASSPVFRSLSPSSAEFLCSRGTLEYFDRQQVVFKQGDTGDSLYLILRGSVQIEVHGQVVKRLYQGNFFGEIALIASIPRTATVRIVEPCILFKISADSFWEVLVQHMDLGIFIETVSETRLREDLSLLPKTGSDS